MVRMEILKENLRFRIIFLIDVVILLLVQVVQGTCLNHYFIKQYEESFTTYFLFLLDFFCLFVFVGTFLVCYNYFTRKTEESSVREKFTSSIKKRFPKSAYGTLPLSYISWIIYVAVLLSKLVIIFKTDMINENKFSGDILQIVVAMSCIVFMLLVEGHNWHKKSSDCYSYVTAICKKTGIEIFDSVEMMDFLISSNKLSPSTENVIFILIAVNFILPAISLFQLNISNFGKAITPICFPLKIVYNILKLVLVDIPFFIVRLHILISYKNASAFIMKNLFYILLALRELYLDLFLYFRPVKPESRTKEEVPLSNEQTQTDEIA